MFKSPTGTLRRMHRHWQRKKVSKYVSDDLKISSCDSDKEASDVPDKGASVESKKKICDKE